MSYTRNINQHPQEYNFKEEKEKNDKPKGKKGDQKEQRDKDGYLKVGPSGGFHFNFYWIYLTFAAILIGVYLFSGNEINIEKGYSDFEKIAQEGCFSQIVVNTKKEEATGILQKAPTDEKYNHIRLIFESNEKDASQKQIFINTGIASSDAFAKDVERWRESEGSKFTADVKYEKTSGWGEMFWSFGSPFIFLFFMWFFLFRRVGGNNGVGGGIGGIFSVGQSKAQEYGKDNKVKVSFQDVAGLSEAKQEIQEIVEFLKNPQKYTDLGGKIPKGALLVGPPGTGKTLLAKAVAGEADVPFFSMSGSDFVEMFVGVGASRVRDLFAKAKAKSPCIIFIDEIDAVGRARSNKAMNGGNDERESTLNQLLTEMDGFGTNSGVIILAATNRADILDKALLRAGRFDRQIHVDLPELQDRIEIFQVHLKPIKLAADMDITKLARQTPGFSGADIANVCNEAALIAARNGKEKVDSEDFNNAVDRIIGGLEKKSKVMTRSEKHSIAIHEAGHATISWHLQYANPLVKVTIVPRGNALGAAWYMPEERQINTKEQMCDELCSLLGGRAAEELFLGHISSGAANDLERVTKQVYAMIVYYGMSERLPNVCYYDSHGNDYGFTKPFSEERARIIDEETSKLIAEQYERAKSILLAHSEGHAQLTKVLEDEEVIFTEDVESIFGPRPWTSRSDELLSLDDTKAAASKDTAEAEPVTDSNNQA